MVMTAFADRTVVTIAVRGHLCVVESLPLGQSPVDYSCRQGKTLESSGQGVQRAGRRAQQNFGVSRDLHFYLPQALPLFLWIPS